MTVIVRTTRQGSAFRKPAYDYIRESDRLPARAAGADPVVRVKLFNPCGIGTWFLTAYDPATGMAQGAAHLFTLEAGDIYIPELVDLRTPPFGLPIERDLHWTPKPLSQVMRDYIMGGGS